jgi:hypothetical protein
MPLLSEEDYLHNRVLDSAEAPKIAGIRISKKKFKDMVDLNDADVFYAKRNTIRSEVEYYRGQYTSVFKLIKADAQGKFSIDASKWKEAQDDLSFYATTEAEMAIYGHIESISQAIKSIIQLADGNASNHFAQLLDNTGTIYAPAAAALLRRIKEEKAAKK